MVEMALVLVPLLLLLLGIFSGGVTMKNWIVVTDAARVGARAGAVGHTAGGCVSAAQASAAGLDLSQLGVTCVSTWLAGAPVQACVQYPWAINLLGMVARQGTLESCSTETSEP